MHPLTRGYIIILEKLFRKKNISSYTQVSQVSLTWAQSKSHWSLRPSWLVWGLALNLSHLPMVSDTDSHSCESSVQARTLIPDMSVIGPDLLNYLAVEGEKLQSNASHPWFATGSLHHLGWTRKIKLPACVVAKPRNSLSWYESNSFKKGHKYALMKCP